MAPLPNDPRQCARVFIDETGCRGTGPNSMPFFGFAAVVVRESKHDQLRAAKRVLNERLDRPPDRFLHWSENLKTHDQRVVACEELSRAPVQIAYSIVNKATVPAKSALTNRDYLYNYPLRFLLERVSWMLTEVGCVGGVTLASVKGLPRAITDDYLDGLKSKQTAIEWNSLADEMRVLQSRERDGLQLADIAAGALDRAVRAAKHAPRRIEPVYLLSLANRIYRRPGKELHRYGMKALADEDFWSSYPWWSDLDSAVP